VIAPGKGEPVRVETIVVPYPGPGEAVVGVQAGGVCHTDLHYTQGGISDDFPFLLGHEPPGWWSRSARTSPMSRPGSS
jgi:S-(hydroxymethyl)mycothiol dehydrogenase